MKKVPSSLSGLLFPSLLVLTACSGPMTASDDSGAKSDNPNVAANEQPAAPGNMPQGQGGQGKSLDQQRRDTLIKVSLDRARRALSSSDWNGALENGLFVLQFQPDNKEAKDIVERAEQLLGERDKGMQRKSLSKIQEILVQQQQVRTRAARHEAVADAHRMQGRYDSAIEEYTRAITLLRYSPFFTPGDKGVAQLQAKLSTARKERQAYELKAQQDRRVATEGELKKQDRMRRIAAQTRSKRMFEDANRAFTQGRYGRAVTVLDQLVHEDPGNKSALALRDLAARARFDSNVDNYRRKWRSRWQRIFDDLSQADLPQTEAIKYDLDRWSWVSKNRGPHQFTSADALESPEERAILDKLSAAKQRFNFASATLKDWADYFASFTGVTFVLDASVTELDEETTTLADFNLPPKTTAQALDIIAAKTGVHWRVRNGVVQLVTKEKAGGKKFMRPFDVRDIVEGVPDRPGPDLKLRVPGEEAAPPDDEPEVSPTVVDASRLEDLIRNNIEPSSWEEGASIATQRGILLVRHTKEVHKKIHQLLSDLRQAVGISVDIESRFLSVEDNFLEDIGVDFRGLGNNSSEGVPGRGLENRPNIGFDDFGRREDVAAGGLGTGTEPGFFYDDGLDGDIMARTENMFDTTLGRGEEGLQASGGLSVQFAFLDDAEVEAILRAVQKQERSEEITAPRILVYNNTRANMQAVREISFIKDFEVEIAQAAAVANPVIDVIKDGVVLDVRPVVSADRRFITMELRPTVMQLKEPIDEFVTTLGTGQPISIQLPVTKLQRVRTTVTMPDGGTMLLGGMMLSNKQRLRSQIPFFGDIPGFNFFFGRQGNSVQNTQVMILIRASIIMPQEHEPAYLPNPLKDIQMGGGK